MTIDDLELLLKKFFNNNSNYFKNITLFKTNNDISSEYKFDHIRILSTTSLDKIIFKLYIPYQKNKNSFIQFYERDKLIKCLITKREASSIWKCVSENYKLKDDDINKYLSKELIDIDVNSINIDEEL